MKWNGIVHIFPFLMPYVGFRRGIKAISFEISHIVTSGKSNVCHITRKLQSLFSDYNSYVITISLVHLNESSPLFERT